jgi:hypothetical protein
VIFIRSERFVPQGNLLAARSLKSVCDERGGSYLTVTALETPPLFGRTNLHPLYSRLARRNSRTSLNPQKIFLFERASAFRKELSGEMLGFARTIQFGVIRNFLKRNSTYGPIRWSARSPDLNPFYFYGVTFETMLI